MASTPAVKKRKPNESGIALFMVMASISVLALLVTEFTYSAQMNQKLAADGLDQLKAHYLAKSGLKLSLLRLKAYVIVKEQIANLTGGGGKTSPVPQSLIDKIWSFPFFYPIPTNLPGLSMGDKEQIEKFQKDSALDGKFSAVIESESSKYNLNMILPGFGPLPGAQPSGSPSSTPSSTPSTTPSSSPSASPSSGPYNADDARKSLSDYLSTIMQNKFLDDPDLANDYRDFRIDDFMDALVSWADPSYERKGSDSKDPYKAKRGPFYSISELHLLPMIDDQLYDYFVPALTAQRTAGINLNSMQEATLRALVPNMTDDEVKEFFKFRDDPDQDNTFQSPDDFFTYLKNSVAAYKSDAAIGTLKTGLAKRNVKLVIEESEFRITVQANVNESSRKIEAWVTLIPSAKTNTPAAKGGTPAPNPAPSAAPAGTGGDPAVPDPGLRITFMRVS